MGIFSNIPPPSNPNRHDAGFKLIPKTALELSKGPTSALNKLLKLMQREPEFEHGAYGLLDKSPAIKHRGDSPHETNWPDEYPVFMDDEIPWSKKFDAHVHPPRYKGVSQPPSSRDILSDLRRPGLTSYVIGPSGRGPKSIESIRFPEDQEPIKDWDLFDFEVERYHRYLADQLGDRFPDKEDYTEFMFNSVEGPQYIRSLLARDAKDEMYDYAYTPATSEHEDIFSKFLEEVD
tara:strand:+ start:8470 stop:9171 length:702 start_codon:yes stop_codon:yes gene_type:complete